MTTIAVSPFLLKDVDLKVGTDNYEAHVSSVEFVPTASTVTWKGLTPSSVFSSIGSATWVCNLSYAQDWDTPASLSNYLLDHEGETVAVHFEPEVGGVGFDAQIIITPGSIGGAIDSTGVGTVSLGVRGRPRKTTTQA
ncbi:MULTISPECIES: hypothetical protein [unclassified Frondihabitans]|uniref:hypothetical protein n=1 Tax=unclassified Frondihabitans TaxID=2626248 RepID=UPI000F4F7EE9|nr:MULTISPECIES: hypothetical protein [unclassified Frondihabitans]RPE75199.1 hypothetical protein EDF37_2803 [Frondihabitans sp. PhB153]RPF04441.1 hypothetical protein EDF39_2871 [Frondihabitans sp. PhB161]